MASPRNKRSSSEQQGQGQQLPRGAQAPLSTQFPPALALVRISIAPRVALQPPALLLHSRHGGGKGKGKREAPAGQPLFTKSFQKAPLSRRVSRKQLPLVSRGPRWQLLAKTAAREAGKCILGENRTAQSKAGLG